MRRNPKRIGFFRTVWIPDEMVFQTYVAALVPPGAIAGFSLTHHQFTNRGKPVVYHEDHADYVATFDRFFFRKISPEARGPPRRLPRPRRRARRRRRAAPRRPPPRPLPG